MLLKLMHMQQLVSITSQGQITIPAFFRRKLGLNKYPKATVEIKNKKIIIEPVPDFLSLAGKLHNKAKKGKTIGQIIKLEHEAIAKAVVKKIVSRK